MSEYIYSGLSNIPSFSLVSNKLSLSKHWVVRLCNTQDICESRDITQGHATQTCTLKCNR